MYKNSFLTEHEVKGPSHKTIDSALNTKLATSKKRWLVLLNKCVNVFSLHIRRHLEYVKTLIKIWIHR